jgi:tetratricopeptide (TPR) repeat protein
MNARLFVPLLTAALLGAAPALRAQDEPAIVPAENPQPRAPLPDDDQPAKPEETRVGAGGMPEVDIEIKTPEAKAAQAEFLKLPAEKREQFARLMNEGQALLAEKRVQEALEKLNDAETLWGVHPNLLNLKGAALVNIRDFERATGYFEKGVALYPDFWQIRFNHAEMLFVTDKFAESEKSFRSLLGKDQGIEGPTRRLVDYKIILCLIKQGKVDEAKKMIANYDIFDDTPVYYYSQAALHFEKGEKDKAEEWVGNARSVYGAQMAAVFEDALNELGWLFTF